MCWTARPVSPSDRELTKRPPKSRHQVLIFLRRKLRTDCIRDFHNSRSPYLFHTTVRGPLSNEAKLGEPNPRNDKVRKFFHFSILRRQFKQGPVGDFDPYLKNDELLLLSGGGVPLLILGKGWRGVGRETIQDLLKTLAATGDNTFF